MLSAEFETERDEPLGSQQLPSFLDPGPEGKRGPELAQGCTPEREGRSLCATDVTMRTWQRVTVMWIEVVGMFALSVAVVWALNGGFPGARVLLRPLAARFYTPLAVFVLFGPAVTAGAVSVWLIKRRHERWNEPMPMLVWPVVAALTGLAVYLGAFVALNSFGS
ncbi:MAG TPA: hypothetical protein VGJ78_24235 [Vicinamibacterales bacterium]|jgi:hypothetical protein